MLNRPPLTRIAALTAAFLAALAIVVAALLRINRTDGFAGCTGTAAFGWTVPLIAGLMIGVVAWILLKSEQAEDDSSIAGISCTCSSCGEHVISGWRLCPYCGNMIGSSEPTYSDEAL